MTRNYLQEDFHDPGKHTGIEYGRADLSAVKGIQRQGSYQEHGKEYETLYKRSIEDPEGFWGEVAAQNLTWFKKWDKVLGL